jgi:hypothetical protein
MNSYLLKSAVVAALGGLLFGFDTAVIAGATGALSAKFALTPAMLGVTVSSALWGTILGAMFGGIPGDRYGRRASLQITAVLYLLSALGCALAFDWYSFLLARFIGGAGNWSVLGARAHVHRGDRAGGQAWTAGRVLPVQHRVRDPAGVLLELHRGHDGLWRCGVAMEARHPGDSGGPVQRDAARDPREPALAGAPRPHARSGRRASQYRRPNYRADLAEIAASVDEGHGDRSEPLFIAKYKFPIFLAVSIGLMAVVMLLLWLFLRWESDPLV